MIMCSRDGGAGKSTLLASWRRGDFWEARGISDPPQVLELTAEQLQVKLFLTAHREHHRVLGATFEKGQMASATASQIQFLHKMSDLDQELEDPKYAGRTVRPQLHVVVLCNELNPLLLANKECWVVYIEDNEAALSDSFRWDFPAEAPSVRAAVGALGKVSNPPKADSKLQGMPQRYQLIKKQVDD